jgi:hypothetical protein
MTEEEWIKALLAEAPELNLDEIRHLRRLITGSGMADGMGLEQSSGRTNPERRAGGSAERKSVG